MNEEMVYSKLAKTMDTLPNGFPATENGVEIKILKKVFTPEEADLFCNLHLSYETPEQISERTGRHLEGLGDKLKTMWEHGQLMGVDFGEVQVYKMLPWVFGIFEFQLKRMDREFVELCEEYNPVYGREFFNSMPQLMQVVPIEKEIKDNQETLPYEQVSTIIENGLSFAVNECICKKEKHILGTPCDKPLEVCMGIAPVPDFFEAGTPWKGRAISKEEAYEILKKSEEAGLVHMTSNVQDGQYYICNCCGCCCGVLRSINELGCTNSINSSYYAQIDEDACIGCGICLDERCQINAIQEEDGVYRVLEDKCIGCGLCATTCPSDAVSIKRKKQEDCVIPPKDENEWFEKKAAARGVDFSMYQ